MSLIAGVPYTFIITATSAAGSTVIGTATATPFTTPGAPTLASATGGTSSATVYFTQVNSNGGNAIMNYQYAYSTSTTQPTTGFTALNPVKTTSPITVPLPAGTYNIWLRAVNAAGPGAISTTYKMATVIAAPGAPMIREATGANNSVTITLSSPTIDNGSLITGYQYSVTATPGTTPGTFSPGGVTWSSSNPLTVTVTNTITLVNGITYNIWLKAVNTVGAGAISDYSTVTVNRVPTPPSNLVATWYITVIATIGSNPVVLCKYVTYSVITGTSIITSVTAVVSDGTNNITVSAAKISSPNPSPWTSYGNANFIIPNQDSYYKLINLTVTSVDGSTSATNVPIFSS